MKRWVATKIIQTVQLQPNDAVILRVKSGVEDGMLRAYCSSIVYDDGTIGHVTIDTSQPIHDTCWVNKIFTVARHCEEREEISTPDVTSDVSMSDAVLYKPYHGVA